MCIFTYLYISWYNITAKKFTMRWKDMSENKIVKPKIDVVFKKLFGDPANIHILKRFISSVLGIEMEKIT